jgi:hypothetical protein
LAIPASQFNEQGLKGNMPVDPAVEVATSAKYSELLTRTPADLFSILGGSFLRRIIAPPGFAYDPTLVLMVRGRLLEDLLVLFLLEALLFVIVINW